MTEREQQDAEAVRRYLSEFGRRGAAAKNGALTSAQLSEVGRRAQAGRATHGSCECLRCGRAWRTYVPIGRPVACPGCQSRKWDVPASTPLSRARARLKRAEVDV